MASATPLAVYQIPAIDGVQNGDASDYGRFDETVLSSFARSWKLDNFDEAGLDPAYDLAYDVTIDSYFYDATESTDVQFYVSTVEGDVSTAVLTLFAGTFNTSGSGAFGIVETFTALGQTEYFLNVVGGQWKGTMDFFLTAAPASPVPAPAALPLLAAGLGGLALLRRRRGRG
ncbi:PEP-CTERM sorting domain-containing protein [uncultured Albimonas sp.]|uniref:PEP-CTERM sorting domain-containing protein n=1 Tax=uncultured Albimonas sp. TaxID=1331701 RepID=UPI0030EB70B2|tara:strand:+ start:1676 stop:2194 length:519 start_codon:yes stop_codon:yes gene_type:complete